MAGLWSRLQREKKYSEALKSYLSALKISKEIGYKKGMATSNLMLGRLSVVLEKWDDAKNYLHESLLLSQAIGHKNIIKESYGAYAELDSAIGNYKEAYNYNRLYSQMKDSILNEESDKQISQLKIQYETEKKDKEIEIKNVKIDQQNAAIRYIIGGFVLLIIFAMIYLRLYNQKRKTTFNHQVLETEMKALRSQMNPHFTFNVLNSIQYYVGGNDMKSAELYLNKFSSLIRMILNQSRNAYISLEQEIKMLKLYLELEEMLFEKKFNYVIKIEESLSPEKILIPGMLIQPLIENAIKHGLAHKKGEAMVTISFSSQNSTLHCTVRDNGIGREAAKKIRTETQHESVATDIIKERMEALSSLYKIRLSYKTEDLFSDEGKAEGTLVSMEIPIGIKSEELIMHDVDRSN